MRSDVVVVGGGPAGWSAAAACAAAGLVTVLVTLDRTASWPATYGVWLDDLAGLDGIDAPSVCERTWPEVTVVARREHRLARAYGRLDNAALAASLAARFAAGGGTVLEGAVTGLEVVGRGRSVRLARGMSVDTALVVDATGHDPVLVRRSRSPQAAVQAAWGVVATCSAPPVRPGSCLLMDWSGPDGGDPTFLYAMDLGDGRWFLEETSLARRPLLPEDVLRRRLDERLAVAGVRLGEVLATERVHIPMGGALPTPGQAAVGFGAAGGLVHPATGYSVGAALRLAPSLAAAAVAALERRATPEAVAAAAEAAVWPSGRRRARSLERYGLDALLRFDRSAVQAFFDAFFDLPDHLWQGYLSGTLPPRDVAALMQRLFLAAPPRLKALLAGGNPLTLARALRAGD